MTLRTLNYENYGIFLIIGNAGFFLSSAVGKPARQLPGPDSGVDEGFGTSGLGVRFWGFLIMVCSTIATKTLF